MGVRRAAAVNAARLSAIASRALGRGGGTALPGLIASAVDPTIVAELSAQLPAGSVVVSGTNGKTTTARMLAAILASSGLSPIRNESGSNLSRGLASSLIRETGLTGNLAARECAIGVFEVDEAALPEVLPAIRPNWLLLLNLFRDQLDRYGEVAAVAGLWKRAIVALPGSTSVVANADDPLIADVAATARGTVTYFGIENAARSLAQEHSSDVKACPRCGGQIRYTTSFLGHLGHYACSTCGFSRPHPQVWATAVKLRGVEGSTFEVHDSGTHDVRLPLPGMYNVYNALAAFAASSVAGVADYEAVQALESVTPAFGRMERLDVDGRSVVLALAKNPAGLNEVMRTIVDGDSPLSLLVMLNDNTADGRDVSWIWDADVETLAGHVAHVVFAGRRAEDMALRFKYASAIESEPANWSVEHDTEKALGAALAATPAGSRLYVIPTYTAMLDVRSTLTRLGHARPYWEE